MSWYESVVRFRWLSQHNKSPMQHNSPSQIGQIGQKLLNLTVDDNKYHVKDMDAIVEVLGILERLPVTKDILESTRLGKTVNEFRRKVNNDYLAKRAKALVKKWRETILIPEDTSSSNQSSHHQNQQTNGNATIDGQSQTKWHPTLHMDPLLKEQIAQANREGHCRTTDEIVRELEERGTQQKLEAAAKSTAATTTATPAAATPKSSGVNTRKQHHHHDSSIDELSTTNNEFVKNYLKSQSELRTKMERQYLDSLARNEFASDENDNENRVLQNQPENITTKIIVDVNVSTSNNNNNSPASSSSYSSQKIKTSANQPHEKPSTSSPSMPPFPNSIINSNNSFNTTTSSTLTTTNSRKRDRVETESPCLIDNMETEEDDDFSRPPHEKYRKLNSSSISSNNYTNNNHQQSTTDSSLFSPTFNSTSHHHDQLLLPTTISPTPLDENLDDIVRSPSSSNNNNNIQNSNSNNQEQFQSSIASISTNIIKSENNLNFTNKLLLTSSSSSPLTSPSGRIDGSTSNNSSRKKMNSLLKSSNHNHHPINNNNSNSNDHLNSPNSVGFDSDLIDNDRNLIPGGEDDNKTTTTTNVTTAITTNRDIFSFDHDESRDTGLFGADFVDSFGIDGSATAADEGEFERQIIDVDTLHTKKVPNVNGNLDSKGEFHEWHETYSVQTSSSGDLYILPYTIIDF